MTTKTSMAVPFLEVGVRNAQTKAEIVGTLSRLIDSTSFIGGAEVQEFTREFGDYCGGVCIPVANGTDALILALRALDIKAGDEVITVPFTFIATTEAITTVGATVRFVDIHPKNYTLDPTLLERAITPKTKAIIPVHLFGQPADMDGINKIARVHGLQVIEDAAQAHGAEYKGRRTGVLGDAACFSFYPTKNLGAFGDAGAVVSPSRDLVAKVAQIADHGRADRYLHAVEGLNSRLDAFQAAVLRIKLRALEAANERRRAIAAEYNKALVHNSYITAPVIEPYAKHVFHLYCVETSFRDVLMKYLKDAAIGCGVYYPVPLHLQPAYARLRLGRGSFPISERVSERILALPMFPDMTDEQVSVVCDALRNFTP
jgi:dTDP-4-amino-4,6-dideoxygalactose transaminase